MTDPSASTSAGDVHHIDDMNIGALLLWGGLSVVLTLISIMGLHALYTHYAGQLQAEKFYNVQYQSALHELDKQRSALVVSTEWVDQSAGIVRVPLTRAKELTLEQFEQQAEK